MCYISSSRIIIWKLLIEENYAKINYVLKHKLSSEQNENNNDII